MRATILTHAAIIIACLLGIVGGGYGWYSAMTKTSTSPKTLMCVWPGGTVTMTGKSIESLEDRKYKITAENGEVVEVAPPLISMCVVAKEIKTPPAVAPKAPEISL